MSAGIEEELAGPMTVTVIRVGLKAADVRSSLPSVVRKTEISESVRGMLMQSGVKMGCPKTEARKARLEC